MKNRSTRFCALAALLLWNAAPLRAEEPAPSPAAAEMLKSMREKGVLSEEEYEDLYRRQTKYEAEERMREDTPAWLRDWTVGGDMRLRYERIDYGDLDISQGRPGIPGSLGGIEPGDDAVDLLRNRALGLRERYRLQFRIGAEKRLGEGFSMGFRIATASETTLSSKLGDALTGNAFRDRTLVDFRSENVTLGDYFSPKGIYLDAAYLRWNPEFAPSFRLTAGKFANPFLSKYFEDRLVWDRDIQPEGLALQYRFDFLPEALWTEMVAGYFLLDEVGAINVSCPTPDSCSPDFPVQDDRDPFLLAYQAGLHYRFEEFAQVGVRGSYYDFERLGARDVAVLIDLGNGGDAVEQNPLFYFLTDGQGNPLERPRSGGRIRELVLDAYATFRPFGEAWPITPFAQYTTLSSAGSERDGTLFGLSIGRSEILKFTAARANLERNAAVAMFTDSDMFDGFTNVKGWHLSLERNITRHVRARLAYMSAETSHEDCQAVSIDGKPGLFCDAATDVNLGGLERQYRSSLLDHRQRWQLDFITEF